jgi:hypothetical protein
MARFRGRGTEDAIGKLSHFGNRSRFSGGNEWITCPAYSHTPPELSGSGRVTHREGSSGGDDGPKVLHRSGYGGSVLKLFDRRPIWALHG